MFSLSLASCNKEENIKEVVAPKNITLDGSTKTINVGEIVQLKAVLHPANADATLLEWNSSDWSIASVDRFGRVTGLEEGTTEISVSAGEVKTSMSINVVGVVVEDLIVNIEGQLLKMTVGETKHINATVSPENATDKRISWETVNPTIVSVDEVGNLKAEKEGETELIVRVGQIEKKYTIRVYVSDIKLSEDELTLMSGSEAKIRVFVPMNSENDPINWTSSDGLIATVIADETNTNEAEIKGFSSGMAKITVTVGNLSADCLVTCIENPVNINEHKVTINLDKIESGQITSIIEDLDNRENSITHYYLKGDFSKLGITVESYDYKQNPFRKATKAEVIDFTAIRPDTWPIVSMDIDDGNGGKIKKEGRGLPSQAFRGEKNKDNEYLYYDNLKEVIFPNEVEIILRGAFRELKLEKLKLPGLSCLGWEILYKSTVTNLYLISSDDFNLQYGKSAKDIFSTFPYQKTNLILNSNKQSEVDSNKYWGLEWSKISYE